MNGVERGTQPGKEKRKPIHEARDSGVDSHQLDFRWYLWLCYGGKEMPAKLEEKKWTIN